MCWMQSRSLLAVVRKNGSRYHGRVIGTGKTGKTISKSKMREVNRFADNFPDAAVLGLVHLRECGGLVIKTPESKAFLSKVLCPHGAFS